MQKKSEHITVRITQKLRILLTENANERTRNLSQHITEVLVDSLDELQKLKLAGKEPMDEY